MNEEVSMMYYIKETPQTILKNIDRRKEITKSLVDEYINEDHDGLTIIACGSSYNACMAARYFLMKYLRADVKLINPFTFIHHEHHFRGKTMTINVSQSGCSTNIIDCVLFEKALGERVISVVGRDDCDVKEYSDLMVNWQVGEEKIGYVTKGVVSLATYLMLFGLEVALKKGTIDHDEYENVLNDMKQAMLIHPQIVDNTIKMFEKNKGWFINSQRVYSISSGPNLATAAEGSLKIAETSCISCLTYEAEEYLHGPIYPVDPNVLMIFIDNNDDQSSQKILDIAKAHMIVSERNIVITNSQEIDDNHAIRTNGETHPLISPLYKLAAVETIAYLRTECTNKYKPHASIINFERENAVATKSRDDLIIDLQGL